MYPKSPGTNTNGEPLPDTSMPSISAVVAASRVAVRRALAIHRALGVPAASWDGKRVVLIPPEELPAVATSPIEGDNDLASSHGVSAQEN